jgi:hypothetical protein
MYILQIFKHIMWFNRNDFHKHVWLNNINQLLISFILYILKINIKTYYINL